jgi:CTP:phosphocholine cytidylyltransferase-like protein
MKEFEIDEEYVEQTINDMMNLVGFLNKEINTLRDKNNDIFNRYMTFCRLASANESMRDSYRLFRNAFRMGFDINHNIFQTEASKKTGWGENNVSENPFFKQEKTNNNELLELFGRAGDGMEKMMESLREFMNKEKEEEEEGVPLH